jgi:hypothetical protein
MDLSKWVEDLTDGASARMISVKLKRSHTAVAKWIRKGDMPCDVVIQMSREYGGDPIQGLLAAGYIRVEDMTAGGMLRAIQFAPSEALIEELARRANDYNDAKREGKPWTPPHVAGPFGEGWL